MTVGPPGGSPPRDPLHDRLRHFPTMLARWKGGRARFWHYQVSHNSFSIRIEKRGVRGNLHIDCSVDFICGPVAWENSDITITLHPEGGFLIEDAAAGLRVVAATVTLRENVKPIGTGEW